MVRLPGTRRSSRVKLRRPSFCAAWAVDGMPLASCHVPQVVVSTAGRFRVRPSWAVMVEIVGADSSGRGDRWPAAWRGHPMTERREGAGADARIERVRDRAGMSVRRGWSDVSGLVNYAMVGVCRSRPSTSAPTVRLAAASTDWVMCHQAIITVAPLSSAAFRTRSLTVRRAEDSRGSATCEEAQ